MMNLARVATAGRNWEGFGADPFHSAIGARLTTEGIQDTGVIACAKHYIANEQEHFRGGSVRNGQLGRASSSDIDDRTLRELYLYPFEESVKAGVGCVMCSYNRINSTFACENSKLINGILKTEVRSSSSSSSLSYG
jgi:beta-glucosidase